MTKVNKVKEALKQTPHEQKLNGAKCQTQM